jgi:hypothetical protein
MSAMSSSPLAEILPEALDAAAGFFERLDPGRVGMRKNGEVRMRRHAPRRPSSWSSAVTGSLVVPIVFLARHLANETRTKRMN